MKTISLRKCAIIGGGAAVFFVLGRYAAIPSPVETVDFCVQYGLLAFLAVACGPLTGTLVGLIGHILIDLSYGELCWSWIIASAAYGGLLGVLSNVVRLKYADADREHLIRFNLCQVATHVVCWAGVAPVLEILFYAENMDRIFEQGLTAALSNSVTTAIVGSVLLIAHNAHKRRKQA